MMTRKVEALQVEIEQQRMETNRMKAQNLSLTTSLESIGLQRFSSHSIHTIAGGFQNSKSNAQERTSIGL